MPKTVTMVETTDIVCVGANQTPRPVLRDDWVVVFMRLEIETTVVAAPPGAIQTGNPVTPDRPEPVVVGEIPEIETGPLTTTLSDVPVTETMPETTTFRDVPVTETIPLTTTFKEVPVTDTTFATVTVTV